MPTSISPRVAQSLFAAAVFLGAGLVFQIQPLMSKLILPWFGGSPGVWTVCLLFFQALLFVGYLYAHGLVQRGSLRGQWRIHSGLLAVALLAPIWPSTAWKPTGDGDPTTAILGLLAWHVGLPYLLLSATGPLLQVWFARAFPGESPYRLYALSNLGSLLGLVSYPFVVDVWLSAQQQVTLWWSGFLGYSLLCVACGGIAVSRGTAAHVNSEPVSTLLGDEPRATWGERLLWFALAMIPSVLLSSVTNKLSIDISPVPFLWVVPLTLYLVSFIICFSRESWASRRVWGPAAVVGLLVSANVIARQLGRGHYGSLPLQFCVHWGTFFSLCMVCHGELVRRKPVSTRASAGSSALTEFYFVMSAGGAAGGLFVAVLAPAFLPLFVEHHLGLLVAALLMPWMWRADLFLSRSRIRNVAARMGVASAVSLLSICLLIDVVSTFNNVRSISRNFYGVLRVIERHLEPPSRSYLSLSHGGTRHGLQPLDPSLARLPTTYYGLKSAVGLALATHHADRPRRIGLVGLGVGTLATYGRQGDVYDFYEIDPAVRDLAQHAFTYLRDSRAEVRLVPGDARLALERREGQQYDVLVLDAFSSDAIPIHLLTAEAFAIYRRHLAPDGIVAAHVSNRYFNLRPVLAGHAERLGWTAIGIADAKSDDELFTYSSSWVLLSPNADVLESGAIGQAERSDLGPPRHWTDARHSLFEVWGTK